MRIELLPLNQINPIEFANSANHPQVSLFLRNSFPYPYTLDHAMSFITYSSQHDGCDYGLVYNGHCVGCIGVTFKNDIYNHNCEIGYWLSYDYWGLGIMSQVVKMMCDFLFDNFPIHKICAEVFAKNIASQHVLEKNHFMKEGYLKEHVFKNGDYHDIIFYSLRREQYGN